MSGHRAVPALRWWLGRVTRFPFATLLVLVALSGLALQLAADRLGFDTDTANLLDPDMPFRQAFTRYTEQFPQYQNTLVAVVEAPAPEYAAATADRLARELRRQDGMFPLVYRLRGNDFLERNALLYLDVERLSTLGDRLAGAQPLLARLVREPSIAGFFDLLTEIGERRDDPGELVPVFEAAERALDATGEPSPVISWQRLIRGTATGSRAPARALVVVAPRLDFDRIMAGRAPMERLDEVIEGLTLDHPDSRIRVTGKVALQHEELLSALGGARSAGLAAVVLVALVLYLALRSWRLLAVALVTLAVGMVLSAGAATLAVGHLNLISIAFAVLYVGLGINYAVHYLIRYREALGTGLSRPQAVTTAGERLGGALTLCTVTTAIGFFAFVPTAFAGVAELGIIAGLSMFITLAVTYTLLPALLTLLPAPRGGGFQAGLPFPSHWLDWPVRHRATVCVTAGLLAVAALLLATQARFDDDPLHLRDPESESVATAMDLLRDGGDVARNLVVMAEDRQRLEAIAAELEALETVRITVGLPDLVPGNQHEKLQQIRDLEFVLGPTVAGRPLELRADPDPAVTIGAAERLLASLRARADPDPSLRGFTRALDAWLQEIRAADDPSALARALQERVLGTLPLALTRLQTALGGARVFTEADLPQSLRARYRSADGHFLLQVFPAGDLGQEAIRHRFVESVQAVVPGVTGVPVLQLESGRAVVSAFRTALAGAIGGIALVLLLLLRNVGTTVRVLIPLLLGGALTVAVMVLLGVPFNFANVIALPLLFGVGVDNGIHMVSRQQETGGGPAGALGTSTARAILFGSLATIASFGNLALSEHRGTATMGVVLSLGMILILATTFYVLPALFRRPPPVDRGTDEP